MKILVQNWLDIKHPEAGGAEVHLHEILKRLVSKGHKIVLISSKYKGSRDEIIDGIHSIHIGKKIFFPLIFFLFYITKFRFKDFDIVIDDFSKVPFFLPCYAKRPIIVIVHHYHGKIYFKELSQPLALCLYLWERLLIPCCYKNSTIVTVSKSTKKDLVKLGIPSKNIHVVYNAINNDLVNEAFNKNIRKKSNRPMILYFGRVKKYKRLNHLLKAFKLVKEKIPKVKLVIAGKGNGYKHLIPLSMILGLDSIEFRGVVSEEEKIKLLKEAWVSVTPSTKEGWGITVIEANACGTPVIAYKVPGLRDSIRHGYNGLLVENGNIKALSNAIINLIEDNDLREELSRNAKEWAKQFNWDKSAERFEKVLKIVMK